MAAGDRIYLDNAATSWPKPDSVYSSIDRYQRKLGAPAGRSAYQEAGDVERLVNDARQRLAELIGAESSSQIIFTLNGTDSLNLAIRGVLRSTDHVVTSVIEHNSVLRPLRYLEDTWDVSVTRVTCSEVGVVDPEEIRTALRPNTKLICLSHASNVTGALQPIEEVGKIAREHEILFLVDAAQSIGNLPIVVTKLGCQMLAAPGHKGLLGPLGTGLLYIAAEIEDQVTPLRFGGTGTQSHEDHQPKTMPDKFEAGNHNVPGIVGLGAGVTFLLEQRVEALRNHHRELTSQLVNGLQAIEGIRVFGPITPYDRVGVVSVNVSGYDPREVASMLDSAYRIQIRAGIHCAPLMHRALGTVDQGGTARFSIGPFTTAEHIDLTVQAMNEIVSTAINT